MIVYLVILFSLIALNLASNWMSWDAIFGYALWAAFWTCLWYWPWVVLTLVAVRIAAQFGFRAYCALERITDRMWRPQADQGG